MAGFAFSLGAYCTVFEVGKWTTCFGVSVGAFCTVFEAGKWTTFEIMLWKNSGKTMTKRVVI